MLGEILQGDIAGLAFDRGYRTAYPLSTTSLNDIVKLVGVEDGENPDLYLNKQALDLLGALRGRIDLPALARLYAKLVSGPTQHRHPHLR